MKRRTLLQAAGSAALLPSLGHAQLSYASGGVGGTHHMSGALFEHAAGIDLIQARYRSGSAGAGDLMGAR